MVQLALIDADILSALMRRRPVAVARAQEYLAVHQRFTISIITRYEILRGLKARQADVQAVAFDAFCQAVEVVPLSDAVIVQAAEIYGTLHKRGALIGDGDIFVAATALVHDLAVITNNEAHFRRVDGLRVENWLA